MIDVGGAALLDGGRPQQCRSRRRRQHPPLRPARPRAAFVRWRLGRVPPGPGGRRLRCRRRLLRGDRRVPQPGRRQDLPAAPGDGPREGRGPALRREPPPAGGLLPRDDPPERDARRREAAPGRRAVVQQPARPRRRLPDRQGLHERHGRHRQAHRPGRPGLPRRARRGVPARPRDRSGGELRRDRRGEPRARRRDRPRDRRQQLRGGRRAVIQRVGDRPAARRSPGSSCWRSRPTRPRACATTASRRSTSSGSPAASWSRRSTSSASTRASCSS